MGTNIKNLGTYGDFTIYLGVYFWNFFTKLLRQYNKPYNKIAPESSSGISSADFALSVCQNPLWLVVWIQHLAPHSGDAFAVRACDIVDYLWWDYTSGVATWRGCKIALEIETRI